MRISRWQSAHDADLTYVAFGIMMAENVSPARRMGTESFTIEDLMRMMVRWVHL